MLHSPGAHAGWTDARVETLKQLWTDGKSASEIAVVMGGLSRSAVIGKVHRLKLERRGSGTSAAQAAYARAQKLQVKRPATPAVGSKGQKSAAGIAHRMTVKAAPPLLRVEPIPDLADGVDVTALCGILDLTNHTCRWPIGDPFDADFGFCGRSPRDGSVYCDHHHKRSTIRLPADAAESDA